MNLKEFSSNKTQSKISNRSSLPGRSHVMETSFVSADPQKLSMIKSMYDIDDKLAKSVLEKYSNNLKNAEDHLQSMGHKKKLAAKGNLVQLLKKRYPHAPEYMIREYLVQSNNKFEETIINLEVAGYKSSHTLPSPLRTSAALSVSTANKAFSSRSMELDDKQVSTNGADKKEAIETLQSKFPQLDATTISISLDVTDNDVALASDILAMKVEEDKWKPEKESDLFETNKNSATRKSKVLVEGKTFSNRSMADESTSGTPLTITPGNIRVQSKVAETKLKNAGYQSKIVGLETKNTGIKSEANGFRSKVVPPAPNATKPAIVIPITKQQPNKTGVTKTGVVKTGVVKTGVTKTDVTKTGVVKTGVTKTGVVYCCHIHACTLFVITENYLKVLKRLT